MAERGDFAEGLIPRIDPRAFLKDYGESGATHAFLYFRFAAAYMTRRTPKGVDLSRSKASAHGRA